MEVVYSIRDMIYVVRGVKVMLDADLVAVYGYTAKAFNQQVKNNIVKFDDDFRFQLTKEEYREILKSKNMTSRLILSIPESKQNNGEETLRSNFLTLELEQGKYSNYQTYKQPQTILNTET